MRITDKPDPAADLVGQVLVLADLVDLAGVVRRAVRFRAGSTCRLRSRHRCSTNAVAFAFSPLTFFGVPSASAIQSAGAPLEIGGDAIAARMAPASSASTAARDHWWDEASVGDEAGVPGPSEGRCGTFRRLARVVLGSSHEICDFER
ncbi:hypothetical protein [Streptomyces sp. NPDC058434]|uniref:hypothetical protein n=1 Tax=Streptomyces sp. NPDC058434 TaxID=3346498 RepID=UPI00365AF5DE